MKYKQLLLSPLGLLPAGLQPADAADIRMPVKAPAVAAPYMPLWTGFYAGVHLGGISDRSKADAFLPTGLPAPVCFTDNCAFSNSQTATGVLGGAQIGYNFQAGNVVYGVETDIGLASARKSTNGVTNGYRWSAESGVDALGTLRGRLGYSFDRALIYATGGLAYGKSRNRFKADAPANYAWSETAGWRAGYAVGGGIEYAIDRNWSVKAEGFYYDLGKKDHISTDTTFGQNYGLQDHMSGVVGRIGVNYSFR